VDTQSVQIRAVQGLSPTQLDDCADLLGTLVAGGAALGWVDPPGRAETEAWIDAVAAESAAGDACIVVGLQDGRLVGLGCWRRYARPTHYPNVDVERLFVDPTVQGRGVGTRIMERLVESAHEHGVEVMTLDFRDGNPAAERLYESVGFREYGRLPRFVAFGSRRYDKRFYAMDLRLSEDTECRVNRRDPK
jgi:GNAT superfamily N-acetyltransferase